MKEKVYYKCMCESFLHLWNIVIFLHYYLYYYLYLPILVLKTTLIMQLNCIQLNKIISTNEFSISLIIEKNTENFQNITRT